MSISFSSALFKKACAYMPGGVNSPVRAFKAVGGEPIFFERGQGAYLFDPSDQRYIDYVGSWGPMILGHAHPAVVSAVTQYVARGLGFGAPHPVEVDMAQKVCELVPSIEQVRFVSSGTEACMFAIRLARGYTGRNKIIKFEGGYHGASDALMAKAGSGVLTLGIPSTPGVPETVAANTLTVAYNDLQAVEHLLSEHGSEVAAVCVEPVAGNMGCVLPKPDFLPGLRSLCDRHGVLLIFDEVMTGFRVALGSAQSYFNVTPDITVLGKIVGGGLPVGALGGHRDIMQSLAPAGDVYQAGTLSGNPIAMVAGLTTLMQLEENAEAYYLQLAQRTQQLAEGLELAAVEAGIALQVNHICGMLGFFFTSSPGVSCFSEVKQTNKAQFRQFFHAMLEAGVYLAPSPFEASFISLAHTQEDIGVTVEAARKTFKKVSSS